MVSEARCSRLQWAPFVPNSRFASTLLLLGRPLYQRHGFEDEGTLTRYAPHCPPRSQRTRQSHQAAHAQRLTASDLKIVIEQDKETGRTRGPLLEWTFDRAPEYCHLVHVPDSIAQYCLGRRGRLFDQIGPVVVKDDEVADALVCAALSLPSPGRSSSMHSTRTTPSRHPPKRASSLNGRSTECAGLRASHWPQAGHAVRAHRICDPRT